MASISICLLYTALANHVKLSSVSDSNSRWAAAFHWKCSWIDLRGALLRCGAGYCRVIHLWGSRNS